MGICGIMNRMISIVHKNWLTCRDFAKFGSVFKFESEVEESFCVGI